MEKKQTAVQHLINHLKEHYHLTEETLYEFKKSLQMECEQFSETFASQLPINDILGVTEPWPLYEVLKKLEEASEILLHKKNYDGHGWEEIHHAAKRAKEIISIFENNTTPKPLNLNK